MSNVVAQMKIYMEQAAADHLAQFENILVNGITGTDQLYRRDGEHRALSALYGYLLGQQINSFQNEVNVLIQSQQKGQDLKTDKTTSALLYWFRCGQLIKLQAKSLVVDQADPNKIPDTNFWKVVEDTFSECKRFFDGIEGNLMFVLKSVYGENWSKEMPEVTMCFEYYVKFWRDHENFK